jgi:hypothetical protein
MKDKALNSFVVKVESEMKERAKLLNDPESRHRLQEEKVAEHSK